MRGVQVTHGMFSKAVEDEVDRILAFFRRKHEELQQRLRVILQQLTGDATQQLVPHPSPAPSGTCNGLIGWT